MNKEKPKAIYTISKKVRLTNSLGFIDEKELEVNGSNSAIVKSIFDQKWKDEQIRKDIKSKESIRRKGKNGRSILYTSPRSLNYL